MSNRTTVAPFFHSATDFFTGGSNSSLGRRAFNSLPILAIVSVKHQVRIIRPVKPKNVAQTDRVRFCGIVARLINTGDFAIFGHFVGL
jgi:hypothetical protein